MQTLMSRRLKTFEAPPVLLGTAEVRTLCLPHQEANILLTGAGATKFGMVKLKTHYRILSKFYSEFSLSVPMLIINKLTANIPYYMFRTKNWSHLSGVILADPCF